MLRSRKSPLWVTAVVFDCLPECWALPRSHPGSTMILLLCAGILVSAYLAVFGSMEQVQGKHSPNRFQFWAIPFLLTNNYWWKFSRCPVLYVDVGGEGSPQGSRGGQTLNRNLSSHPFILSLSSLQERGMRLCVSSCPSLVPCSSFREQERALSGTFPVTPRGSPLLIIHNRKRLPSLPTPQWSRKIIRPVSLLSSPFSWKLLRTGSRRSLRVIWNLSLPLRVGAIATSRPIVSSGAIATSRPIVPSGAIPTSRPIVPSGAIRAKIQNHDQAPEAPKLKEGGERFSPLPT